MLTLLQSARVMVSPILASTGMNTKNFYAMSAGLPVVTTTLGARGLHWDSYLTDAAAHKRFEQAMIVADGAAAFASALTHAYTDADTHAAFTAGGLALGAHMLRSRQFQSDLAAVLAYLNTAVANPTRRPTFHFIPARQFVKDRLAAKVTYNSGIN
jgi:hypothetical protein